MVVAHKLLPTSVGCTIPGLTTATVHFFCTRSLCCVRSLPAPQVLIAYCCLLQDPDHTIFSARLYSDACSSACGRDGVKDLAGLGRHLGRAVLVDNSPYSFLLQPANGLPCLPYHGDQGDRQLLCVILPLLRSLSQLGDIRPLLDSKFRVREWLASKGVTPPPAYQSRQAAEEGW